MWVAMPTRCPGVGRWECMHLLTVISASTPTRGCPGRSSGTLHRRLDFCLSVGTGREVWRGRYEEAGGLILNLRRKPASCSHAYSSLFAGTGKRSVKKWPHFNSAENRPVDILDLAESYMAPNHAFSHWNLYFENVWRPKPR